MGVVRKVSEGPEVAFVGNDPRDKSHVTVRDARLQARYKDAKSKADEVLEACSVIAAGQLRGVLQIIEDADKDGNKLEAAREAIWVFSQYGLRIENSSSMEERMALVEMMNSEMADVLGSEAHGLKIDGKPIKKDKKLQKGMGWLEI